jgi:hypothetical protein
MIKICIFPAKKSPAAGGMSMSVGGPGKFATVAARTSSNHNDLPWTWLGLIQILQFQGSLSISK